MIRKLKIISKKLISRMTRRNTSLVKREHLNREGLLFGQVGYNQYGGYFFPRNAIKRVAIQKVMKGQVYEPDTIRFMINNSKGNDIIHAGTFFGDFIPALASGCKDSTIWAFEPNTESFRCAQITILMNNLSNVRLNNFGLSEKPDVLQFQVRDQSGALGGASRIVKDQGNSKQTTQITTVSLDEFIPKEAKIGILQLDVEGHELEALKGAIGIIRRELPIIILEDNNQIAKGEWFKDNILSLGYEEIGTLHTNTIYKK